MTKNTFLYCRAERVSVSGRSGFTLLELSVVFTVIALIIGGLVAGQSMIRSSQLRAVTSEVTRYMQAMTDFRDKYQGLPGDLANAESIWGADTRGGDTCPAIDYDVTPTLTVCNGNGDGRIGTIDGSGVTTATAYESFRAWQELANAGFISGNYVGVSATGSSYNAVVGKNVPASQLDGAGYTVFYVNLPAGDTNTYAANYGHRLDFGKVVTGQWTYGAVLTPAEAFSIDTKMDDGLPAYGKVLTFKPALLPNCATSDTAALAAYAATHPNPTCALTFIMGF